MAKAQSRIICVDFILPLSERTAVGHVDGNSKQASPSGSNRLGAGQVSFASVFQSEISSHSEENRSSDEDVIITSAVVAAVMIPSPTLFATYAKRMGHFPAVVLDIVSGETGVATRRTAMPHPRLAS